MLHHRLPDDRALPVHQLHHLGRQAGLKQDLHQEVRGVGYVLGRLEDHRIPAQQRGEHLPRRDREREIERRDESATPIGRRKLIAHLLRSSDGTVRPNSRRPSVWA